MPVIKRVKGRLPLDTSISEMLGGQKGRLTDRAAKLSKGDLVDLWKGKATSTTRGLTTSDIDSIRGAFAGQIGTKPIAGLAAAAGDINCCCCCCPCCCAETVQEPFVAAR